MRGDLTGAWVNDGELYLNIVHLCRHPRVRSYFISMVQVQVQLSGAGQLPPNFPLFYLNLHLRKAA